MRQSVIYADPADLWQRITARCVVTASGCWEWQGATNGRGYGRICSGRKGKAVLVHRVAVIARDGAIPDGLTVDHLCHNADAGCIDGDACRHRLCVNPDHLGVCSREQNRRNAGYRRRASPCATT